MTGSDSEETAKHLWPSLLGDQAGSIGEASTAATDRSSQVKSSQVVGLRTRSLLPANRNPNAIYDNMYTWNIMHHSFVK